MRSLLLLVLAALYLHGEGVSEGGFGPWPTRASAPGWWLQLHERYMGAGINPISAGFPVAAPDTVSVTFTPQGPLPWLPRNVAIDYLIICAPPNTSVPTGSIYQTASANGISPLSPAAAKSELYRRQSFNGWSLLLDTATMGSLAIPVLGQSGIISMSTKWVVAALGGHAVFDYASTRISAAIPNPAPTIDILLDPNATLIFTGACVEATMAVVNNKSQKSARKRALSVRTSLSAVR